MTQEPDLHWLAESGQIDRLREALAAGADPTLRDERGRLALHLAVATGRIDTVAALLDAGADPEAAEAASPGYRSLHRACVTAETPDRERVAMIRFLLGRGVDVRADDGRGSTALHLVIPWCDGELVDSLLEAGADPSVADRSGRTPLHVACRRGADSAVERLLGDDGELATPEHLQRADSALARLEDEVILESLRQAGANVDAADLQGLTPLHLATEDGNARTVLTLLRLGADVSARDAYGAMPLHRAASREIAKALLDADAPLDPPDRDGRTPLHRAVGAGRIDVAECLLSEGALAGIGDRDGRTALHVAAEAGRAHTVERLLDAGADPNAQDADGHTPLQLARAAGHSLVTSTLKKRGGRGRRGFPFFG